MKKALYTLIETGSTNLNGEEFETLEEALSMMNYYDRMLTAKEKKAGASVYVGLAEFETNDSDDRRDWDDMHDGFIQTWEPGDSTPRIGARIAEERIKKNLSQTELAERIGTTRQQIGKYETDTQDMTVARLFQIAAALGVEPDALVK